MDKQKEPLKHITLHIHPEDYERGQQLAEITGVNFRAHVRSAVRQYIRAHQKILDNKGINFELETPA